MDNIINSFLSQLQNEATAINTTFSSTKDQKIRKALLKQMKTMNTISELCLDLRDTIKNLNESKD